MRYLMGVMAILFLLAPLAVDAQSVASSGELQDYAQRDAADLAEFTGGHAGVVVLIVVLVAAIVLIAVILPW